MSFNDVAIRVQGLSKRYEIYAAPRDRLKQFVLPPLQGLAGLPPKQYFREFWALRDVSFQVKKGETVGIIGRNGSGKSTLLQLICGTLNPTAGSIQTNGRIAALLELGSGFNPEFTGRENVFLNGRILGLTQKEIDSRYDQIVEFADIDDFIDQPVKTYSSGMFVRLAFAVQAHIDASIVIIDEALTVGDVFFRQKCYARLEQLRNSGAAILLVSHSMPEIEQYCQWAILLDHGKQRFTGAAAEASKHYYLLHQSETATPPPPSSITDSNKLHPVPIGADFQPPPDESFIDISEKPQIGNGQARCTGFAICNIENEPSMTFRQGDTAVFFYEFELMESIGVPVCGLVITNEKGTIVHGKNSWQHESDVPSSYGQGGKIRCRHEIVLDLACGEHVIEIGLASVSLDMWKARSQISHEEMSLRRTRICHIANAGVISIGLAQKNGVAILTHHGIANLPGKIEVSSIPPSIAGHTTAMHKKTDEFFA